MNNYFLENPISFNILGLTDTDTSLEKSKLYIKYKIIVLGDINDNIKKNILNFNKTKSPKILQNFYGKNWKKKLFINSNLNKYTDIKGGDDNNDLKDDNIINFDDIDFDNILEESKTSEEYLYSDSINSSIISSDTDDKDIIITKKDKKISNTEYKIIYNTDISIYPQDTIKELKEKIFLITNIQIYKQHVNYYYFNKYIPLMYNLYLNNNIIDINIDKINNGNSNGNGNGNEEYKIDKILDIPVIQYLYNNKNDLKIKAYDTTNLVYQIYKKYNITTFNIINLDEFFQNKKPDLEKLYSTDIQQIELIYYSFIIKYYPICTFELFEDYIINEKEIKNKYTDIYLNNNIINEKYKNEKEIIKSENKISNTELNKYVLNNFSISIMSSNIKIKSLETEPILNLRNLFDNIEISKFHNLNYVKCILEINNKPIILIKYNDLKSNIEIKEKTFLIKNITNYNKIIFNIQIISNKYKITKNSEKYVSLILDIYGNYSIKSKLREEYNMQFNDLIEFNQNIVNPIIEQINNIKLNQTYIFNNMNSKIIKLNKYNSFISDLNINIYWKNIITNNGYNELIKILNKYVNANIFTYKEINDNKISDTLDNFKEFIIRKGIYDFNVDKIEFLSSNLNNYYKYLSDPSVKQKWIKLFLLSNTIKFIHRLNDIKIEIVKIKQTEFNIVSNYIYKLFYLNYNKFFISGDLKISKKKISSLKQIDPVLYNYALDNKADKELYSRKCQKQLQPIIVTKQDILNKNLKNTIKYWNFTTNTSNHYYCPNKTYPFVKFLTNIHPQNYCIPCCKKKDVKDVNVISKYSNIHNICLNNYIYDPKINIIEEKSRYIMTYGKDIEINRIMFLPEDTLETLFNSNLYNNDNSNTNLNLDLDQTNTNNNFKNNKFYLLGTKQNLLNINNIGVLYILTDVFKFYDLKKFINFIINYLLKNKKLFNLLLNGKLNKYFYDFKSFLSILTKIFIDNKHFETNFNKWNELFIDIVKYMNFYIIIFNDDNDNILYKIPDNTYNLDYLFPNNQDINYMFVLKKNINISGSNKYNQIYTPIFIINPELYFKNNNIIQTTFNSNSINDQNNIINIIKKMINQNLHLTKTDANYHNKIIDLNIIYLFIKFYKKKYSISKYFVNNNNFCYAILLTNLNSNYIIYVPIIESNINIINKKNTKLISYDIFYRNKYNIIIKNLFSFISDFNLFNFDKSLDFNIINNDILKNYYTNVKINFNNLTNFDHFDINLINSIYPFLYISKFILYKNNIIGIVCNNLHFYISNMSINSVQIIYNNNKKNIIKILNDNKYKYSNIFKIITRIFNFNNNVIFKTLLYNPTDINFSVLNNIKIKTDNRIKLYNSSLYNRYLYQLVIIEFSLYFSSYKNTKIRNIINKTINNMQFHEFDLNYLNNPNSILYINLLNYFKLNYSDINYLDIISNSYFNLTNIINNILNLTLKQTFNTINNKELNNIIKKNIINKINESIFNFDNLFIQQFLIMDNDTIFKQLKIISKNFVYFGKLPNNMIFPNTFGSCSLNNIKNKKLNQSYCFGNKLIINEKKLNSIINIIVSEINNTYINKFLFSTVFQDNIINKLDFKQFINEQIIIKI